MHNSKYNNVSLILGSASILRSVKWKEVAKNELKTMRSRSQGCMS